MLVVQFLGSIIDKGERNSLRENDQQLTRVMFEVVNSNMIDTTISPIDILDRMDVAGVAIRKAA